MLLKTFAIAKMWKTCFALLDKIMILLSGGFSLKFAYSLQMKKDYENFKQLLIKINYAQFKWYVYGDFKMLGVLLVCRVDTQNTLAFFAFGIVKLTVSTMRKYICDTERTNTRNVQCQQGASCKPGKGFTATSTYQTRSSKTVC